MALDTNNTNQCYLHGRLVALIVNTIGEDKLPASFPELCAPGRKNAAFLYWAKEALKSGDSTLIEVASKTNLNIPDVDDSCYWIGYYHQKAALEQ